MSGLTYAKFFPSDWRSGATYALSLEEEGLYIRSCSYMWDTGMPVPGDDGVAAKILNVQILKYQKVMASLIAKGKMIRAQGVLINQRVMDEIDAYRGAVEERAKRAKLGHDRQKVNADKFELFAAQLTELREENRRLAVAQAGTPAHSPGYTPHQTGGVSLGAPRGDTSWVDQDNTNENNGGDEHEQSRRAAKPEARSQKPDTKKDKTPPSPKGGLRQRDFEDAVLTRQFEEFWQAFPGSAPPTGRKTDKAKVWDAFKRLVTNTHRQRLRATAEELIAAARAYAATNPDPKYIPLPMTWMNGGRWTDYAGASQLAGSAGDIGVAPNGKQWGWWEKPGLLEKLKALPLAHWEDALAKTPPNGMWPWWMFGPPPGHADCFLPAEIVARNGWVEKYQGQITGQIGASVQGRRCGSEKRLAFA